MLQRIKKIIFKKKRKRKGSLVSDMTDLWKRYRRFAHQNWITIVTSLLSVSLCSFILYMLLSPLPELPVLNFADKQPLASGTTQAGSIASLDTYTNLLKTRNLFKPSIPIPSEKKIGKTTAQQLAERLQFLGTSGNEKNLTALVFIPERGPGSFHVGDRVAEFVLKDIKKDSMVLELENEQITLKR
jgi:hypothetical protein